MQYCLCYICYLSIFLSISLYMKGMYPPRCQHNVIMATRALNPHHTTHTLSQKCKDYRITIMAVTRRKHFFYKLVLSCFCGIGASCLLLILIISYKFGRHLKIHWWVQKNEKKNYLFLVNNLHTLHMFL